MDSLYGFPTPLGQITPKFALVGMIAVGIFAVIMLIIKKRK